MPIKSYSTVHIILPITPKIITKINKIREELTRRFGGGTYSRVAIPSPFVGYWVTEREGAEIIIADDLSLTVVDVDIDEHPDYRDYFEAFKIQRMDKSHPDYLGEDEIWITIYNSYRIVHGVIMTTIRHEDTSDVIEDQSVIINGPVYREEVTDNKGNATFRGLPDGRYTITVSRAEFMPFNTEVMIVEGSSITVSLYLTHNTNV